jgi:SutA RNAP-binding domain
MAFQRPPTKAELRRRLKREVENFLQSGGKVDTVARGVSGRDTDRPLKRVLFDSPKEQRTYVNDVIATIDARRKPAASQTKPKPSRRKMKIIYDDFGEPLRRIWVEDQ